MHDSSVIHFQWFVSERGHRVVDLVEKGRVRGQSLVAADVRVRTTSPLDAPEALFRNFADLGHGNRFRVTLAFKERCVEFADSHGLLGLPDQIRKARGGGLGQVEPLRDWLREVDALHRAVGLWEALAAKNRGFMAKSIGRRRPGSVGYGGRSVSFSGYRSDVASGLERGDVMAWGRLCLSELVSAKLREHTSAELVIDRSATGLSFRVVPQNLLGAIWVQFSRVVEGSRDIVCCESCGTWIFISPDTFRTNRRYCSDSCRVRAHKRRKREAQKLREEGATLRTIANEFDTKVEVVKGWVAGVEKGIPRKTRRSPPQRMG